MKNRTLKAILAALGLGALAPAGASAVPSHITYTGELTASNGLPYAGDVAVMARIYGQMSGGAALFEQDLGEISVANGVLEADLMGATLMQTLQGSDNLWLEFEVDGEILSPRQKLSSVPYAMVAGNAAMLGGKPAGDFVTAENINEFIDAENLPSNGINQVSNGALKNFFGDVIRFSGGSAQPIFDFDPFTPGAPAQLSFATTESTGSYFTAIEVKASFTLTQASRLKVTLTPPPATGVAPIVVIDQVVTAGAYNPVWSPANVPEMQGLLGNTAGGTWQIRFEDLDDSVFGSGAVGQLTGFTTEYDVVRADHMQVAGRLDVSGNMTVGGTVSAASFVGDGSNLGGFVKIRNVTVRENATRQPLSDATLHVLEQFTVDKKSPTSILLIQGTVSGFGNYSGSMQQGWRLGTGTEVLAQSHMYDENATSKIYSSQVVIAGHTQTGPQQMVFRFFTSNNQGGNRPFSVYNPNANDDGRLGQTRSSYVVWEIEP
jgi:hypothetical protein